MPSKLQKKYQILMLEVLVLFSLTPVRWTSECAWGYEEPNKTMEVVYFKWFFPLETNLLPCYSDSKSNRQEKEEGTRFFKKMRFCQKC